MLKFVLKIVNVAEENEKIRDLNELEQTANAFIKDPKIKALTAQPLIIVTDEGLVVGAMIDYEMAPR